MSTIINLLGNNYPHTDATQQGRDTISTTQHGGGDAVNTT